MRPCRRGRRRARGWRLSASRPELPAAFKRPPRYFSAIARNAADEIAQIVREVDVVAILEALPGEIAVAAERDLFHEVQPQRIGPEPLRCVERLDRRPERLAHLLALAGAPSRARTPACGTGNAGAHQHGRPDHAVEPGDVLADHVKIRRPPAFEQRLSVP